MPHSLGLVDQALGAEQKGFTFLQISDSHMGFDKPANPNAKGTLEEAIGRIKALPAKPAFMIHTGDITHLSRESEFADAEKIIGQAKLDDGSIISMPSRWRPSSIDAACTSSICSARRRRAPAIAPRP